VAEVKSASSTERRANLALSYQELLTVIVRLRFGLQTVADEDNFRTYVKDGLSLAMQEGLARGYSPNDIKLASFAVVALLDESVLNLKDPVFTRWTGQPLALEITGRQVAGEEFFDYAQQLLSRSDSAEVADLLEVFYLCLLLGYRGKYAFSGVGDLRAYMDSIKDKIVRCRGDDALISPQATLPTEPARGSPGDPWLRPLALAAALSVALTLVIFVACTIFLNEGVAELASR
jgi:type VI secretion system protein ImpK